MQVIADHLSAEEVEDIKEMFRKMDLDKDGTISFEELKTGLQNSGSHLAESDVQMLVDAVCIYLLLYVFKFICILIYRWCIYVI